MHTLATVKVLVENDPLANALQSRDRCAQGHCAGENDEDVLHHFAQREDNTRYTDQIDRAQIKRTRERCAAKDSQLGLCPVTEPGLLEEN